MPQTNRPAVSIRRRVSRLVYAVEPVEQRLLLAITATFTPATGLLFVSGDNAPNNITISRNAAGTLLVNAGAIPISGGAATVANTSSIFVSALDGADTVTLEELNGALPAATLSGGPANDILIGGSGNDCILGEAGNDTLLGKGGVDSLDGGADGDVLTGGTGDDFVVGGSEDDRLIWNPGEGTDLNEGGTGTDTIEVNGGNGAESFTITPNGTRVRFDRVTPAPFSLDINAAEKLTLNCNGGNDTVAGSNGLSTLIALTIDGGNNDDFITGGDGADVLLGGAGNDTVTPGRGNDVVLAGSEDDLLVWNPGDNSDTFEGQAGVDTLLFNGANISENMGVSANGARVRLTRDVAAITMDLDDVEAINIKALGGADNVTVGDMTGTDGPAVTVDLSASGGGGDGAADTVIVNATSAPDTIIVTGSAASVSVLGLASQTIATNGESANDRVLLNSLGGADLVSASTLQAGAMTLVVDGGTESDSILGGLGVDSLLGNAGNDTVNGNGGADFLSGGADNDSLIGGPGNDSVNGDAGNDQMVWNPGDGSDVNEGGADIDTAEVNGDNLTDSFTITANGTRVRFDQINLTPFTLDIGTTESLTVNCNGGADTVVGGNGLSLLIAVTIDGGSEGDSLTGTDGIDLILGGSGDDTVTAGRGNDVVLAGTENDTLVWNPGDGSDTFEGQAGSDTMLFNGANIAETIAATANGSRVRFTRDVAAITMDLNGMENLIFNALGGADTITIGDLAGTDMSAVRLDLSASGGVIGDGAADVVTVNGLAGGGAVTIHNADLGDTVLVNTDGVGTANAIFDATQRFATLSVGTGGRATVAANGSRVLGMTTLTLTGTGKLDLTDNSAILDYPILGVSPIGTVRAQLLSGFAGGAWTGPGIVSSVSAGTNNAVGYAEATALFSTFLTTWRGQTIDSSSILLSHTLRGDTNLDRAVNFNDLVTLAQNYNLSGAAIVWTKGDTNYDSAVDFPDLVALAQNYNLSLPGLTAGRSAAARRDGGIAGDILR